MFRRPDGFVTVEVGSESFRGRYYIRNNKLVVKTGCFKKASIDAAVLGGDHGEAAEKLARLVLTELVREFADAPSVDGGLSLTGTTTVICS